MARRRRYLDDINPRVISRSDATSAYANNINQQMINRMPIRQGTKYYYDDLANAQNAKDKEALRRRVNARGKDTTNQERNRIQAVANKRKVMAKKYTKLSGLENRERPIPKVKQAQLYDKDIVDLAKTQQAFYRDAAANIGVDWGNSLNPYTQGDLIQNAAQSFGMSNLSPYTLPAFGSLSPNIAPINFIKAGIGGELGGALGSHIGSIVSDSPYAPVVGGVLGGVVGGGMNVKNVPKNVSLRNPLINQIKGVKQLVEHQFKPIYYNKTAKIPIFNRNTIMDRLYNLIDPRYNIIKNLMNDEFYDMVRASDYTVGKQFPKDNLFPGYMETVDVPQDIMDSILSQTLPRIKTASSDMLSKIAKVIDKNSKVNIVSRDAMDIMNPNASGFVLSDGTGRISIRDFMNADVFGHEFRHKLQDIGVTLTDTQRKILNDAYGKLFTTMGKWKPSIKEMFKKGYKQRFKDYPYLDLEQETTNFNVRNKLLPEELKHSSVPRQNNYIDNLTDDEILMALYDSNGYGRQFINRLNSRYKGNIPRKRINALRNALKFVPAATGVTLGATNSIQ